MGIDFCIQVDQAAPANQGIFWYYRERSQDANLDRGLHLRADRYCQKTSPIAQ